MKDSALILNEFHMPSFKADNKMFYQTVSAWLMKELRKHRN